MALRKLLIPMNEVFLSVVIKQMKLVPNVNVYSLKNNICNPYQFEVLSCRRYHISSSLNFVDAVTTINKEDGILNDTRENVNLMRTDPIDNDPVFSSLFMGTTSEISVPKSNKALKTLEPRPFDQLPQENRPSYNFAAYANVSQTLQELMKMGVDISQWDSNYEEISFILQLDFERDMKNHIVFLHDLGVSTEDFGLFFTKNPFIFKVEIPTLQTRINYLISKKFLKENIARIVSRNPQWLLFNTEQIDKKLGYFQKTFELTGSEVRYLATKQPKLITTKVFELRKMYFSLHEECGFTKEQLKELLLVRPKLFKEKTDCILRRFEVAHREVGFELEQLVRFPQVLGTRHFLIKQRHNFLQHLRRDQYDPTLPNYVSPAALVVGSDIEFCRNVAKVSVMEFNQFLKTL